MNKQHHELAHKIYDAFNRGDWDALDDCFTDGFVDHEVPPEMGTGLAGVKAYVGMFRAGFPDLKFELVDLISEGERAACHTRVTGTHKGEFMGIAPTGKKIDVGGVDFVRIRNGKTAEHWGYSSEMKLMEQLGAVPIPEQRGTIELPTETRT